jgi:flavoprotein
MTTNDSTNDSDNNGDGEISNDTKCCPCDSSKNGTRKTNEINDAIASFKTKHCKNGKVIDKNGNPIDMKDLASNFPEISFNLEKCATCNPCAEGCNFKLTSGSERITVEENLRPVDSAVISTN